MVANVRNRRAVITQVTPFDGPAGRLHLVAVDYADLELPTSESLLWEREVGATLTPPKALPDVANRPAMQPILFDAIVRAARWQALTPFITPDGLGTAPRLPIASPFHGAVQVEDYQLEPLLRALQMPRVSLLLADDVGLGKTIEAGLILSELLLRRRVRRVLILTPGSLRDQWQEEMRDKFALHFDVVDRDATWQLRKKIGLDANPWRTHPRIVSSYHYLRQPDVLEQLLATCREHPDHARLPWDLLVVDEAHNLMPGPFGQDSDLVEMLRQISPFFEHKLFLTATPHNGHTESFTGLLELLDPVRFSKSDELSAGDRRRLDDVLVRRLKREISAHDQNLGKVPRFGRRSVEAVSVSFTKAEQALSQAFRKFKEAFTKELARRPKKGQIAGRFALNAFEKRLLSCPVTFADSWFRLLEGLEDPTTPEATDHELDAANQSTLDDQAQSDDAERASRERTTSRIIGAWLRPMATGIFLPPAIAAVTAALKALGLTAPSSPSDAPQHPQHDGRYAALRKLIDAHLRSASTWRSDERLILFTEYKTTLDYLVSRLRADFSADLSTIASLYGGMDKSQRLAVRLAFNDPSSDLRILVATDAASEGLNLQETARHLLHFDVPWNPSRLEQRNGRLDRHGQGRDVTIFHFTSEDDDDLAFLGKVVAKVDKIREDLGAVGEVFDEAFTSRFDDGVAADKVSDELDLQVAERQAATALPTTAAATVDTAEIDALHRELDLSPDALAATLRLALVRDQGTLTGPDAEHLYRLADIPSRWAPIIDDHLRLPTSTRNGVGPLPSLAFDPQIFIDTRSGRPVFRPKKSARLIHLAHPVYRQTLTALSRLRFDAATDESLSRWTTRRTVLPPDLTAMVVISIEELVVNALREPFHQWVRTLHIPVRGRTLGEPLPHIPPSDDVPHRSDQPPTSADVARAQALWEDLEDDLKDLLQAHATRLDTLVRAGLQTGLAESLGHARAAMKARRDELTKALRAITPQKIATARRRDLERELRRLDRMQPDLFGASTPSTRKNDLQAALATLDADARAEAERRQARYRDNLETLAKEERRVIEHLLPQRYTLTTHRGEHAVQLYPIALEIRLPLGGRA